MAVSLGSLSGGVTFTFTPEESGLFITLTGLGYSFLLTLVIGPGNTCSCTERSAFQMVQFPSVSLHQSHLPPLVNPSLVS